MPSRPGSARGKSLRRCDPRDSRRSSAQRRRSAAPAGRGRRAAARASAASRRGPGVAPERLAGLGGRGLEAPVGLARGAVRRGPRSSAARGGARAEHEALAERVRGEPVGAVEAGAGALADRVEARAASCARRGRSRCRPSRSGRRARPGPGRRWDRARRRASAAKTLGKRSGSTPRRSSRTWSVPSAAIRSRIAARHRVAGSELVGEAAPGRVEQRRSLAAHRLGDQLCRRASCRAARSAVGWNWQSSRSASSAPAALASTEPAPIAPQGFVVRLQSAAAPPVESTVAAAPTGSRVGDHAGAALAVAPQRQRRAALRGRRSVRRRRRARRAAR